ncbi:MAG: T9SS type A sorting domain-containing protein, partial [Bacteroidales bacterium]|nr:T9SS type A sorting domain-containing protein [Bacteroidales bacterium]
VDFSPDLPNAGKFQMNGLSRVLRITLEPNSVKDLSQVNDFNVFPNPSKGDISLAFRFPVQNVDLSVYDIHGQGLIHETLNIKEKNVQPVLHLNTIPPGIYIIRVKNPDMVQYRRIIIVK